jgi:predicted DNA-binding protein
MAAKNPRLTAVVEKPLYQWLKKVSRKRGVSLSLLVRDILREAYEREEDVYWAREGEERLATFDRKKALSHDEVWEKSE